MWLATCERISSLSISTSARKRLATEMSACSGHAKNQLMLVQLVSAGKRRQRERNCSPTGDMQHTTCMSRRTWLTKNSQSASFESM